MSSSDPKDIAFEVPQDAIEVVDELEIGFDVLSDDGIGELLCDAFSVDFVGDLFAELGEVTLAVGVLDVREEVGPLSHEIIAAAEQITSSAHFGRIDVSLGDHAGTQEGGDFTGVDAIVFDLGAVDGPHVESVTEDERDIFFGTEISEPIPGEHTFDGDDDVFAVRFDHREEGIGLSMDVFMEQDVPVLVEDAEIHGPGVEVDTAVEFMLLSVESHEASSLVKGCSSTEHTREGMLRRRPQ